MLSGAEATWLHLDGNITSRSSAGARRIIIGKRNCMPGEAPRAAAAQSPALNWQDVAQLKDEGRLVFVVNSKVYCVDDDFVHPGGTEVRNTWEKYT